MVQLKPADDGMHDAYVIPPPNLSRNASQLSMSTLASERAPFKATGTLGDQHNLNSQESDHAYSSAGSATDALSVPTKRPIVRLVNHFELKSGSANQDSSINNFLYRT